MSELKPCPFCNCPEVTLRDDGEVHCDLCQSSTGFDKQWNLRPIEDAQAHELATANSKVDDLREEFTIAAMQLAKANARLEAVREWRSAFPVSCCCDYPDHGGGTCVYCHEDIKELDAALADTDTPTAGKVLAVATEPCFQDHDIPGSQWRTPFTSYDVPDHVREVTVTVTERNKK